MSNFEKDKIDASEWARDLLDNPDTFVVLDTETTGLPQDDPEIVQFGLIDGYGNTLIDTLVKPNKAIPPKATSIHGITNEMVQDGMDFSTLLLKMLDHITDKRVIVYNVAYDYEVILRCLLRRNWGRLEAGQLLEKAGTWECAMLQYAAWYGDWNDYRQSYRWQKLQGDHSALGDCVATYNLLKKMAGI